MNLLLLGLAVATLVCGVLLAQLQHASDAQFAHLPPDLQPYRPVLLSVVGAVLASLHLLPELDAQAALKGAAAATGLSDFDDDTGEFRFALDVLVKSLQTDSALHPVGKFLLRKNLDVWLENRLKVVEYQKKHGIASDSVAAPVFIVGTPRSGTTFLYNLLFLDDDNFRGPLLWELTDPVPPLPPATESSGFSPARLLRIAKNEVGVSAFRFLAPNFAQVHPVSSLMPEECMGFLSSTLMTYNFNTMSNASSYTDWLHTQDMTNAIRFHKRYLSVMQDGNRTARRWLLKAPWHMNHLDALLTVYPDAKIVNPHRDIGGMLASLASLHARLYGMVSDHLDLHALGSYQLKVWDIVVGKYVKVRKSKKWDDRFIDLAFSQLHADPIAQVRKVYAFLGLTLTERAEARMRHWLQNDSRLGKKNASGAHVYKSEWFGLPEKMAGVRPSFFEYENMFRGYL